MVQILFNLMLTCFVRVPTCKWRSIHILQIGCVLNPDVRLPRQHFRHHKRQTRQQSFWTSLMRLAFSPKCRWIGATTWQNQQNDVLKCCLGRKVIRFWDTAMVRHLISHRSFLWSASWSARLALFSSSQPGCTLVLTMLRGIVYSFVFCVRRAAFPRGCWRSAGKTVCVCG